MGLLNWNIHVPSPLVGHWNAATSVASGGVAPRWADCGGEPGSQQPNGLCQGITVAILNHINIYEKSERNNNYTVYMFGFVNFRKIHFISAIWKGLRIYADLPGFW